MHFKERFVQWVVASTALYVLSSVAFGFRIYQRSRGKRLRAADYVVLFAWILLSAFYGTTVYDAYSDLVDKDTVSTGEATLVDQIFTILLTLTTPTSKLSVALLYLELAPTTWHRRAINTLIVAIVLGTIGSTLIMALGCMGKPEAPKLMTRQEFLSVDDDRCRLLIDNVLSNSLMNIVFEFALVGLAVPFVVKIRATASQKASLLFAFSLGLFTIGASVTFAVMTKRLYRLGNDGDEHAGRSYVAYMWAITEVNAGVIFSNLLPTRGILIKYINAGISAFRSRVGLRRKSVGSNTSSDISPSAEKVDVHVRSFSDVVIQDIELQTNKR